MNRSLRSHRYRVNYYFTMGAAAGVVQIPAGFAVGGSEQLALATELALARGKALDLPVALAGYGHIP
jgi:hypothetical protein